MAAAFRSRNSMIPNPRSLFSTLSEKSSSIPFRSLKSTIRSERDPEKLAEIFQNSSNWPRFRRDRSIFDLTVRKLAGAHRPDLIDRVLGHQKSFAAASASKSEGFWMRIMKLYSNSGMVDEAVRIFDQMEEIGCHRTDKSLCALLSTFLSNRQFDRLHESYADIPNKFRIPLSVVACNLVVRAYVEEKSLELALSFVSKMEKENGVKPDISSYNILLGGFYDAGDEIRFNEILKEISIKGLNADVSTYNYRIFSHCKNGESFRAKEIIDVMILKGIKPNLATYNAVIDGFCKEADLTSAKSVFQSMQSIGGVWPNSVTYVTLIQHLVEKGDFDLALLMCKDSLKKKWIPPFASMVGLVNGLVNLSRVNEAKMIVENMKKKLTGGAVDSWTKVEGTLPL